MAIPFKLLVGFKRFHELAQAKKFQCGAEREAAGAISNVFLAVTGRTGP